MTTLQIVDSADVVLFDLYAPTGGSNPGTLKTWLLGDFNLGATQTDYSYFEPESSDGGSVAHRRHPLTESTFRLRVAATSADNLQAGVNSLARLLDSGGIIKWQGDNMSEARYIDFVSGLIPGLFRGQDLALYDTLKRFEDPSGLPVTIWRQPFLRGPSVAVTAAAAPNDPASANGRVYGFTASGDAPSPGVLTVTGDASAKITEVLVARRSRVIAISDTALTDYRDFTHWAQCEATGGGWTVALTADTATAVDADGSPGSGSSVAQTAYTTNPTVMAKRVRLTRTTRLDSLRGEFDVYARVKASAVSVHTLQLRWGASTADPAPMSNAEVEHDLTAATAFGYIDIPLGRISVPFDATLGGVGLELWSRRDSGTGTLNWDVLSFVPVDEMASRMLAEARSAESWAGGTLVSPVANPAGGTAAAPGSVLIMDTTTDNGGVPPNTGRVLVAGRHRWTFTVQNVSGAAATVVLRVRNITDSTDLVTKTATVPYSLSEVEEIVLEAGIPTGAHSAADLYQEQIDDPSAVLFYGTSITHEFIPAIGSTEKVRADADRGTVEKTDSANALLQDLTIEGPVPALVHPGLNVFYLHYADTLKDNAYEVGESVRARSPTVQVVYSPRYWV